MEQRDSSPDYDDGTWTWKDGSAARDATISAIRRVFPEVNLLKCSVFLCLHSQKISNLCHPVLHVSFTSDCALFWS